ncbi:DUF6171 family protein [Cohnella suwonensis]|uniref:DUF6171 family protein n=1 Tax=Cohnella suwonensis TaxID=696072 RepID=A0ABW0LRN1_9BACL
MAATGTDVWHCKGCTATVHMTPEEIEQAFGSATGIKSVKLTTEAEYERRMDACRSCESFQFGTTCRWCGCLMAVKAKLENAKCPHPSGNRWTIHSSRENVTGK